MYARSVVRGEFDLRHVTARLGVVPQPDGHCALPTSGVRVEPTAFVSEPGGFTTSRFTVERSQANRLLGLWLLWWSVSLVCRRDGSSGAGTCVARGAGEWRSNCTRRGG